VLLPSMMNFSQLMEKVGVQSMTLYDGKGKDNLNPFRPWRKGEEDNIQDSIKYYYQMFVNIATKDRPSLDKQKLIDVYGANVYPATIAKELGYIDETNASYHHTLELLAEKIGITDHYYQVIELDRRSWLNELFNSEAQLFSGKVTHHLALPAEMSPELSNQYLYLYRP
jgi:protease IV